MSTHIINFPGADIHTTTITSVSNVSVGENLDVTSNLTVSGNTALSSNLFVTGNVGIGTTEPTESLDIVGNLNLQKVSNTASIKLNSNIVMELPKHDRPLVKYPEIDLLSNDDGNGYVASGSSRYSAAYEYYEAFDQKTNASDDNTSNTGLYGAWISANNTFDTNGDPTSTSNTFPGTSYRGEYCSIQMPTRIKLKEFQIYPRGAATYTASAKPKDMRVFGTNDGGITWTHIKQYQDLSFTGTDRAGIRLHVDSDELFNTFAFFVEKTIASTVVYCAIGRLELYGTEEGDTSVDVVHRSIPNKPSPQHLEVYWDANDSNSYSFADSSNVYDLSGSGVTGTITGTNGFDAEYNAWVFDGSGDYISTTHNLGTGGQPVHSMSIWFKNVDPNPNYVYVAALGGAGYAQQSTIQLVNDKIRYTKRDYAHEANNSFVNNTWVHVVTTYSGGDFTQGNCKLYIDGVEAAVTSSGTGTPSTFTVATNSLYLGARTDGSGGQFDGSIANFRLFSKALSADQVRELYEYDAEHFGHRQNLVSLHKGNLGVGVAHPTSRFEVAGTETLQEYPPRGMTGYETYMEGHGVFRASASTVRNQTLTNAGNAAWHAFDSEAINTYWININDDDDYKYAGTSNTYSGISQLSPETPLGEYITLECPYKIIPQMVGFKPYDNLNHQPLNAVVYGSNDGYTWTFISSLQNMSGYSTSYIKTFSLNNTSKEGYRYVSFITTQVTGTSPYLRFFTYRIYGTPAPSSLEDGHLTLGKALTLPRVSGHPAGAETPRAESLVVHYDTTVDSVVSGSTVVDISGTGNNGTLINGATYSSTDRTLVFDGSTGYLLLNDLPQADGNFIHSVSYWLQDLRPSGATSENFLYFGAAASANQDFQIQYNYNGNGTIYLGTQDNWLTLGNFGDLGGTGKKILRGEWNHYAYTYNGTSTQPANLKFYMNGEEMPMSGSGSSSALSFSTGSTPFYIGRHSSPVYPNNFEGKFSNFKMYNVALTPEEVAMEYALGRTGKSLNLTDTALCLGGTVPRAQLDVRGSIIVNDVVRQPNKPFFACDVANFGLKDNGTQTIYVHNDRTDTLTAISETGCRWKLGATTGNHTFRTNNVKLVRVLNDTTSETSGVKVPYTGYYHLTHLTRTKNLNVGTSFWIYSQRHDKYIQTSMGADRVPWSGNTGHTEIPNSVSASLYLEGGDAVIFVLNNVTVSQNPTTGGYEQFVSLVML
jgi:hypothetical protein